MADLREDISRQFAQFGGHGDLIEEAEFNEGEPEVFGFVVGLAAGEEEREWVFGGSGD